MFATSCAPEMVKGAAGKAAWVNEHSSVKQSVKQSLSISNFLISIQLMVFISGILLRVSSCLNRPWFSRHSPSSENGVSPTLLATAA
jgi:hypothetical protein